jgi:hypothetical protein
VPRFKNLPGGFTRVNRIDNRTNDKAEMAVIEILGNPHIEYEKNEMEIEIEENEIQSFWSWEAGLLKEEIMYWEGLLRQLKTKIDDEARSLIA